MDEFFLNNLDGVGKKLSMEIRRDARELVSTLIYNLQSRIFHSI